MYFKHTTCLECIYKGTIECPNVQIKDEKPVGLHNLIDPFQFYCSKAKSEEEEKTFRFVYNNFRKMAEEQELDWDKIFSETLDLQIGPYFSILNMFEYALEHSEFDFNKEPKIAVRLLNIQNKIRDTLFKYSSFAIFDKMKEEDTL